MFFSVDTTTHASFWKFPPPTFLSMPAAGINISDHSVKMVIFRNNDPEQIVAEKMTLGEGVVVSGEIRKPKEIERILANLKRKHNLRYVRVSIPEEKGYIFNLTIPILNEKEATETLRFQIPEHVPLSVHEAIYDFDVVKKDEEKGEMEISVSVLPQEIVTQYLSLCKKTSLIPLSFEIEAQATSRALIKEGDRSTHMIVDIGRSRTGISIVTGSAVRYTSTAELGGDVLTEAIQKHFNISVEEADTLKQEKGFMKTRESADLYEVLASSLSALSDEITKRIMYWENKSGSSVREEGEIASVIICGGNATVPGLREYLESTLSKDVLIGNVWTNVVSFDDFVPPISYRNSLAYATAIGLGLSSE